MASMQSLHGQFRAMRHITRCADKEIGAEALVLLSCPHGPSSFLLTDLHAIALSTDFFNLLGARRPGRPARRWRA